MIGRRAESEVLRDAASSDEAEFIVVYGRRRVGKTYLVRQVFQGEFTFAYTGVANVTRRVQLAQFMRTLRDAGWAARQPVLTWFDAFDELRHFLSSQPDGARPLVFLDEMPWMDNRKSEFVSAFEHFWNGWASGVKGFTLIACGSATAWITKRIFRNAGGLFGRVTRQIRLVPFTLAECRDYLAAAGVVWNLRDVIECFMVFGGIPYYLHLLDRRRSLAQNVDALLLDEAGPLRTEFDTLFGTLFQNASGHVEVVKALAHRTIGLTRTDLADQVELRDGGNLTRILSELEQSGFIRTYLPYGRAKNGGLIQLIDPFTAFHLRFVENRRPGRSWAASIDSAEHRAWSGLAFEQACLAHVPQITRALGISGVAHDVSSWRSRDTPGAQIDLVLARSDHIVNLCEMKYVNGEFAVDKRTDLDLRRKAAVFTRETKTRDAVHLTLVTTYGLAATAYSSVFQSTVTMDDLFATGG